MNTMKLVTVERHGSRHSRWLTRKPNVSYRTMWTDHKGRNSWIEGMPLKARIYHHIHRMYYHQAANGQGRSWQKAAKNLEKHQRLFAFQTDRWDKWI